MGKGERGKLCSSPRDSAQPASASVQLTNAQKNFAPGQETSSQRDFVASQKTVAQGGLHHAMRQTRRGAFHQPGRQVCFKFCSSPNKTSAQTSSISYRKTALGENFVFCICQERQMSGGNMWQPIKIESQRKFVAVRKDKRAEKIVAAERTNAQEDFVSAHMTECSGTLRRPTTQDTITQKTLQQYIRQDARGKLCINPKDRCT